MAIHGVDKSNQGGRVPPKGKRSTTNSGAQKTIETLQKRLDKAKDEVEAAADKVVACADLVDQFQTIAEQDRDGIMATAKELDLEVKGNSADREVLAAIFKKMAESILGTKATT